MNTRLGVFVSAFGIGLSGAMMPGAVLAATISSATYWGFWAGPLVVLGHGILELALVIGVVLGLARLLDHKGVFAVIGIGGGAALLWMGAGMMANAASVSLQVDPARPPDWLIRHPIAAGLALSAANPYFIFWWATIGLTYITRSRLLGPAGTTSFFAGHILSDLVWYSFISLGIALGKRFISDTALQNMIRVCAALLIGFGIYFAVSGVMKLRRGVVEKPPRDQITIRSS
ncbi:MAG: LysE family transporter [Planctomycetota bacterium]